MQQMKPFRWLALVCLAALLLGAWERRREKVDVYRDETPNYPQAMARLYPDRSQVEYLLGRWKATQGGEQLDPQELQDPDRLAELLARTRERLAPAVEHYERALAAGLKSEENLQYNYALSLIQMRADPEKIDRAIADWRRNFPNSEYRDLAERRRAIEEVFDKLEKLVQARRQNQELEQRRRKFEELYGPSRPLPTR